DLGAARPAATILPRPSCAPPCSLPGRDAGSMREPGRGSRTWKSATGL
ncbi:MAG: hypothetical protein AVDCRST_MAG37-3124, partial [uncultured Rubrobacteraceae bacterium]